MTHPAVSKLAKSVFRLLPTTDPVYTQLTSDQLAEIHDIRRELTESIVVETQDKDYVFTDTANYATPNDRTVNLNVPRRVDWHINNDPYLTRIYHHYGTGGNSGKVYTGFDLTLPPDVLGTVQLIVLDTADNNALSGSSQFYMHPFTNASNSKYKVSNLITYTESSGDNNTTAVGGLKIRKSVFWSRNFQLIYEVFKNGQRIIDKRFTGNVKMHVTIFENSSSKPVREFSLHASPLGEEDFITYNQQELIGAVVADTHQGVLT